MSNPGFATSLADWTLPLPTQAEWNAEDANGCIDSGSARLTNTATTASSDVVLLQQCFVLPGPGSYTLIADARILAGQSTTGSVIARLNVFSSTTTCSGGLLSTSGQYVTQGPDAWETLNSTQSISYSAGQMAQLEIAVRKTEDAGELTALVDGVHLIYGP